MDTLKNLIRNLADKVDRLLGGVQLQEIPVRLGTENPPAAHMLR